MNPEKQFEIFERLTFIIHELNDLRKDLDTMFNDYAGQSIKGWTVLYREDLVRMNASRFLKIPRWRCECDKCGNEQLIPHDELIGLDTHPECEECLKQTEMEF